MDQLWTFFLTSLLIIYYMAQSAYIRPLAKNYHDFTQKKIEETTEQTPLKFKTKNTQQYVKKPFRHPPSVVQPTLPLQPQTQERGFWSFCFLSQCCKARKRHTNQKSQTNSPRNQAEGVEHKERGGTCWCKCLEPEICEECSPRLCKRCVEKKCLKSTLCEECQKKLCQKCKKLIHSNFCEDKPKIRSYPIRFKNKSNLHFVDCKCRECEKFIQQAKQIVPPLGSAGQASKEQQIKVSFHQMSRDFREVESVIHH